MGSPLSAVVTNLVMEYTESKLLENVGIRFYKMYVDDILLCLPSNQINFVYIKINSFYDNIRFTIEREVSNTINFYLGQYRIPMVK